MQIYIGHIDKRLNSTKHEVTGEWTTKGAVNVTLKEPTDVKNPVFLLNRASYYPPPPEGSGQLKYELKPSDNYIYVPKWGYYWIDDVVYETNNLISIITHRDVLASGKDYLKKKAYTSYCSDKEHVEDFRLKDDIRLSPDVPAVENTINLSDIEGTLAHDIFVRLPGDGMFIVRCLVDNGGIIAYALTLNQFIDFYKQFITNAPNTLDDFTCKYFGNNWKSCFSSVYFIPVYPEKMSEIWGNTETELYVGRISLDISGSFCYSAAPVAWATGGTRLDLTFPLDNLCDNIKFLRAPKYSSVSFEYPGGCLDISDEELVRTKSVWFEETMNLLDGEYSANLYTFALVEQIPGVYAYTKGKCLGKIKISLGSDITGMMQSGQSNGDFLIDKLVQGAHALPAIAAATFTAGMSVPLGETAGAARGAGFSMRESAQLELMSANPKSVNAIGHSISTGIAGLFQPLGQSPACKNINVGSGLTTYYHQDINNPNEWAKDQFRLTISTCVPGILNFTDDVAITKYDEFCTQHGYASNKWIDLSELPENTYVQCVGFSAGKNNDPEFTLYPPEIAELNSMVNSGIYLEDWT